MVYQINPKATWSDGVPISAQDFIYNWQAQSGNPAYKDVGGKAFLPVGTAGGDSSIKSVTSSNNGKTATAVFSSPFSDWQSLYGAGMPFAPAHIASKVGFNNGFQTFGAAVQVSGGPYMIQSYAQGQDLVEVEIRTTGARPASWTRSSSGSSSTTPRFPPPRQTARSTW